MPTFANKLFPKRIALGIAVTLAGLALVFLQFFTDVFDNRISLKLVLFSGVLVVGGIGVALSARGRVCSQCGVPTAAGSVLFPADWYGHLASAVEQLSSGNTGPLLQFANAARAPSGTPAIATLDSESCPQCRQLARVSASRKQLNAQGEYEEKQRTQWVTLQGQPATQVLSVQ
jgi:uncharacterized membrane protein